MKKHKELICPLCGKAYSEPPAISRKDNSTLICADCGTRESLEIYGVSIEKQDEIIDAIHRSKESVVK